MQDSLNDSADAAEAERSGTDIAGKVISEEDIVVCGVPFDANSSYLRGPALAPPKIREALYCSSANLSTEKQEDLGQVASWHIVADLEIDDDADAFDTIEQGITAHLSAGRRVISLGGDHSITLPLIRAHAARYPRLSILHFDAHPDIYDVLDGNRNSHACPFARIMEEGLVERLLQVGIRTMTAHQKEQTERFGVEVIDMANIERARELTFEGPVYISLDMDCLDPAFAPGVSHHEPGGMSTREVLQTIQNLDATVVGADIVEYNPKRDINDMTSMVAAKLLKEIISKMLVGEPQ